MTAIRLWNLESNKNKANIKSIKETKQDIRTCRGGNLCPDIIILENAGSGVRNYRNEADNFRAFVGNAVAVTGGTECDVTGNDGLHNTVIVILCSAFQNIENLGIALMHMISDAAAGVQGKLRKQSALSVELFRIRNKVAHLHGSLAAFHLLIIIYLAFFLVSDHSNELLSADDIYPR